MKLPDCVEWGQEHSQLVEFELLLEELKAILSEVEAKVELMPVQMKLQLALDLLELPEVLQLEWDVEVEQSSLELELQN